MTRPTTGAPSHAAAVRTSAEHRKKFLFLFYPGKITENLKKLETAVRGSNVGQSVAYTIWQRDVCLRSCDEIRTDMGAVRDASHRDISAHDRRDQPKRDAAAEHLARLRHPRLVLVPAGRARAEHRLHQELHRQHGTDQPDAVQRGGVRRLFAAETASHCGADRSRIKHRHRPSASLITFTRGLLFQTVCYTCTVLHKNAQYFAELRCDFTAYCVGHISQLLINYWCSVTNVLCYCEYYLILVWVVFLNN